MVIHVLRDVFKSEARHGLTDGQTYGRDATLAITD